MKKAPVWILAALLGCSGAYFTSLGLVRLCRGKFPSGQDLHIIWVMQRNVAHGHLPGFISADVNPIYEFPNVVHNGMLVTHVHPPWAFLSGFLFVPPLPWPLIRFYAATVGAMAVALMIIWAGWLARPLGAAAIALCAVLPPAMLSVTYCLSGGQYTVCVTGTLVGCFILAQSGRETLAGLLLGIALLKPNITLPFALVFLVRGNWKLLAVAAIYNLFTTAGAWALTGVDPLKLLRIAISNTHYFAHFSHSLPYLIAMRYGMTPTAMLLFSGMVMTLGLAGLYLAKLRGCGLLTLMGIAAAVSQFGMYRREYDSCVMVFLLINTALVALSGTSVWRWIAFLSVTISLCWPIQMRAHEHIGIQTAEAIAWTIGLIAVVTADRKATSQPQPIHA